MSFTARSILIVIPARAGSKGIVNKNLRRVQGVPLVARTIRAALSVGQECIVTVSTNSNTIAEVASAEGALVFRRAESISGDTASSESAVLDVLDQLKVSPSGFLPNFTLLLQCTSPFTTAQDIELTIQKLEYFDSVFTGTPDHSFRWSIGCQDSATPLHHEITSPRKRRQDLDEIVRETGAVYGFRTDQFLRTKNRFFGKIGVVMVPSLRSLEIDSHDDLELARRVAASITRVDDVARGAK